MRGRGALGLSPIGTANPSRSGDNVGNIRVGDPLDLILKSKLASLEARNLQLVAGRLSGKVANPFIELPVLGFEGLERRSRLVVIHCEWF